MEPNKDLYLFSTLIHMFRESGMLALGKIANPMTGQIERNLLQAQMSIDIMEMLERKTMGRLNPEEERLLKYTLQDLRLNYLEEHNKDHIAKNNPVDSSEKPAVQINP